MRNGFLRYIVAAFLFLPSMAVCATAPSDAVVRGMRCEYMDSPIGVDVVSPRLTWEYAASGYRPGSCRVELSSDSLFSDPMAWEGPDTGRMTVGIPRESGRKWYWRVISRDAVGKRYVSPVAHFETGIMSQSDWSADWITDSHDTGYGPAPELGYTFSVPEIKGEARAYVGAVGYYEMEINGKRVGKSHMDPGFTHYDRRNLYAVHDVTGLLKEGENEIAVTLGNGFANVQSNDSWGQEKAPWRTRPLFLCEIWIDGKPVALSSEDWKCGEGPVIYNNLYSGVHHDARVQRIVSEPVRVASRPSSRMKSQIMPPILPTDTIRPSLIKNWGDTVYLFDMGKNISGVCRLDVNGKRGTQLSLAHGELLKESGRLEQGNLDIYYHPMRGDEHFQTDLYILSGNSAGESFLPPFTYHGFRYVEVRASRPVKLSEKSVTGIMMHTALPRIGTFRCSDTLLNKIYEATMLSYVDNLHSIPTDCPQREKNGWTADAHVAVDLGLLNFDGITFYEKWMDDFIDNQLPNGNVAGIVPCAGWGYGDSPGPVWDAALFIVPLAIYDYYGDDTALKKMWPTMVRYIGWLDSLRNDDGVWRCGIGDWLPYDTKTPTDFTSTLYAYADYRMMARIARILGEDPGPYLKKKRATADVINTLFFNPEKALYANGSQAAQAIALYWDVVPAEYVDGVASNLERMVRENGYAVDFGLLGTKSVLRMLTRHGFLDTAWRLATQTDAPSWGYWIDKLGYSTLPETWTLSPEFRDASLNHVFFGDIAAWMTNDIAGLNFDEERPGFRHVVIRPNFFRNLDWAEASYHSVMGPVATRWERKSDGIELSVTVPPGSSATVMAGESPVTLEAGRHILKISDPKPNSI